MYDEAWVDLNPSKSLKLDTLISIPSGNYVVWFAVKDKRSSIEYSTTFDVKVTSADGKALLGTYEWDEKSHTCQLKFENDPQGVIVELK